MEVEKRKGITATKSTTTQYHAYSYADMVLSLYEPIPGTCRREDQEAVRFGKADTRRHWREKKRKVLLTAYYDVRTMIATLSNAVG